jgi:hypothetical protein
MGLVGRLSNPDLATLFQSLTARNWKQARRQGLSASGVAPDGRRKFGTVRDAIIQVLEQSGGELRVRDIHHGVEKVLGESVATSSVKGYLHKGCRRKAPLFEYHGPDGCRLAP